MAKRHPFEYQKPKDSHISAIQNVRVAIDEAYLSVLANVPKCAERTLAVRKLEEASMWANKAIVFDGESYAE